MNESPRFATTQWTLVSAAGQSASPESRLALAQLCSAYWYPLYAFVRRQGNQPAEAQDITQAFFAELLEKGRLQQADQSRGRFRSFLLSSMTNFVANRARDARALKRGGGHTHLSLDFERGEERYSREPVHELTPERVFERRWAATILDHTVHRLREEYATSGKLTLFEALSPHLGGDAGDPYADIATRLQMTEGAVKVAVHRLRKRCKELLRSEIAQTVSDTADVDLELRELFDAVREE